MSNTLNVIDAAADKEILYTKAEIEVALRESLFFILRTLNHNRKAREESLDLRMKELDKREVALDQKLKKQSILIDLKKLEKTTAQCLKCRSDEPIQCDFGDTLGNGWYELMAICTCCHYEWCVGEMKKGI